MTIPLIASEFSAFFQAVHGVPPFPWQARLLERIAAEGRWPDLLDLPTGSGKTAALDIAIFHLALQAGDGTARSAAMRTALVVDRRLVVDAGFERAQRISKTLTKADAPDVVRRVANRLRLLAGDSAPPLVVRRLRGGVPREDDWARSPCQPTILCSTVDQVGSRLLFRGYGVAESMAPVHAGLLGSDCLILLDEAHLSEPFRQTVSAIVSLRSLRGPDESPLHVTLLSATAGGGTGLSFTLTEEDRVNAILSRRLIAGKPVTLKKLEGAPNARPERLAEEARAAVAWLQANGVAAPAVAVVVNRIARARAIFETLRSGTAPTCETLLVVGATRSVDRDRIARQLTRIKTDAASDGAPCLERPLVVVATQTIEAGADLDFDGLVTEAAPLDSLRQRFGRVNRAGRNITPYGRIIAYDADLKGNDPVYGSAIGATWQSLGGEGAGIDFGIAALDAVLAAKGLTGPAMHPLLAPRADAPVLMPAHVALWSETSPKPVCDPEPALFLHGPNRDPAGVQLLWRADLDFSLPDEQLIELLTLVPPVAAETIQLPVWAVRAWLAGSEADIADVASQENSEVGVSRRPFFVWAGTGNPRTGRHHDTADIRPGDTVIVPSHYGGCDEHGWNPDSSDWTDDVYVEAARPFEERRLVLRIAEGLIEQAERSRLAAGSSSAVSEETARMRARDITRKVSGLLDALGPSPDLEVIVEALESIGLPHPYAEFRVRRRKDVRYRPSFPYRREAEDERRGVVLVGALHAREDQLIEAASGDLGDGTTEDDEAASFTGREQLLALHSDKVRAMAAGFAARSGLREHIVADIALAGWLHDAGKADRRFQRLLASTDPFAAAHGRVLAKSKEGRSPRGAWERSGLPPHWRHEASSVRLALANPRLQDAHDPALVLWLIGTHHGHGRPFFPHADAADAGPRRLPEVEGLTTATLLPGYGPQSLGFEVDGLDWAAIFAALKARYGTWGLARLEAVLRLADHRASGATSGECE